MRLGKPGRCLSAEEKCLYRPYFSEEVLERARVVEGKVPFWLRRCMNAVVVGECIYLRQGVYRPGTVRGIELLGHELTHVEQFGNGMTLLKYLWQSRKGYRNNPYEIEARDRGACIRRACEAMAGSVQV